jgi:ABC-type branched-subunit amino acid transport system substrate-binding protein
VLSFTSDEPGRPVFKLLKKEFKKTGGTVRSKSSEPSEFVYKEQIAKLKDTEAIFSVGFPEHFEEIFKQLRQETYQGSILGSSDSAIPSIFNVPEANGVYLAAPIIYNPNFLFAKEVKERYEAKYDRYFCHFAGNGYDTIRLLAGPLQDKEVSRESVKNLLEEGFMYHGVFGEHDVKPGEHDITFPLHPARIVNGKLKYLL